MSTTRDWLAWAIRKTHTASPEHPERVGTLDLAPHQVSATDRLASILEHHGGALLADSVGMGKTRVAVAVAVRLRRKAGGQRNVVVCSPARVLPQWRAVCHKGGLANVSFVSHNAASRDVDVPANAILIVDEAHRFRNPRTKRYGWLSDAATHSDILLLTATPIANSIWDLYHLLSVFLPDHALRGWSGKDLRDAFEGSETDQFDLTQLLVHVCVRRMSASVGFSQPSAKLQVLEYQAPEDESWLWKNLDSQIADVSFELLRQDWPNGLLRQYISRRWEAGPEALLETLNYLTEFHERWLEVTRAGGTLARGEFKNLFGEEHRQNVFPFMFESIPEPELAADQPPASTQGQTANLQAIENDLAKLNALRTRAEYACQNSGIATAIAGLYEEVPKKLLVFTSFVPAAEGLFRSLVGALGSQVSIGLLTGQRASATGLGKVGSHELLQRFAPSAQGSTTIPTHQEIDILIATDCISEGTNLQDCSRIVLADLPYSPLTVEQRVGRLIRPGSTALEVKIYLPRPKDWNDTLGLRTRLLSKMEAADSAGSSYRNIWDSRPAQSHSNPLRLLTDLDALIAKHPDRPVPAMARTRNGDTEFMLLRVKIGREVTLRLACIRAGRWCTVNSALPDIVRTFDSEQNAVASDPAAHIQKLADEHEIMLKATLRSPVRLPLDAPQCRAWMILREADNEIQEGPLHWNEIRARLLEPMKVGHQRALEDALKSNPSGLLQFVSKLPESMEHQVSVEIVGVLSSDQYTSG